MKIRVTLMTENDKPVSALGADPEEKVRKAWNIMLHLISLQSEDSAYVENVEIISENNDEIVRMTDDLISRLSELRSQYNCFKENERDIYHTLSEVIKTLKEHKTGEWINCKYPLGECSNCHAIVDIQNNEANYCPVCGSRNRGEEDGCD